MGKIPFLKRKDAKPEEIVEEAEETAQPSEKAQQEAIEVSVASEESTGAPETNQEALPDSFELLSKAIMVFRQIRTARSKASSELEEAERVLTQNLLSQHREEVRTKRRKLEEDLAELDVSLNQARMVADQVIAKVWNKVIAEVKEKVRILHHDFDVEVTDQFVAAARAWPELRRRSSSIDERARALTSFGADFGKNGVHFGGLPTNRWRPSEMLEDVLHGIKNGRISPSGWDDNL